MRTIKNAVINRADIDCERFLTYWVHVDYDSGGQAFGGYGLGGDFGCEAIKRLLEVVGVESWLKLQGKPVRIDADWGKIFRIGNYIKEEWLDLEALAIELKLR